jgi:uncharacterized membrane protein YphA (DoxX/SURF4 family)
MQTSSVFWMSSSRDNKNDLPVAVVRLAVGVIFLLFAQYKIVSAKFVSTGLAAWINTFIKDGAYPFIAPILQNIVLPYAKTFAVIVVLSELAIGLSLTAGVLSRAASAAGLVYMAILFLASDYPGAGAPLWQFVGLSLRHSVLALCFYLFWQGDPEAKLSLRSASWIKPLFRRGPAGSELL